MCHINDLNDDELEMIFKRLSRDDRLKCKEVCKKWYEYFMESTVFREDRTIYFKKQSTIAEMVPVLEAAGGSFEKLVIVELNKNEDFGEFGNCLRDNGFKEVCFKSFNPTYYGLLAKLTFVESLSIESTENYPEFSNNSLENVFFENLKKVAVTIVNADFGIMKNMINKELPALRKMIPKDVVIHFKVDCLESELRPKKLPNFNTTMDALNVNFELIKAEVIGYSSLEREQLLELSKCGLQQFTVYFPESLPFKIEELLNNMENLRELQIREFEDFSILRELSAKNLAKITELCIIDAICKSNHDCLSFPSLLELVIYGAQCKECMKAILNGKMPNLIELTVCGYPSSMTLQNWENLELLNFHNCLPSLRKIEVDGMEFGTLELSVDAIKKIDKLCPKLERFELKTNGYWEKEVKVSPSLDYLRDALTNGFENLDTFRVTGNKGWSQLELTKKDGVVRYCNFKDDFI